MVFVYDNYVIISVFPQNGNTFFAMIGYIANEKDTASPAVSFYGFVIYLKYATAEANIFMS